MKKNNTKFEKIEFIPVKINKKELKKMDLEKISFKYEKSIGALKITPVSYYFLQSENENLNKLDENAKNSNSNLIKDQTTKKQPKEQSFTSVVFDVENNENSNKSINQLNDVYIFEPIKEQKLESDDFVNSNIENEKRFDDLDNNEFVTKEESIETINRINDDPEDTTDIQLISDEQTGENSLNSNEQNVKKDDSIDKVEDNFENNIEDKVIVEEKVDSKLESMDLDNLEDELSKNNDNFENEVLKENDEEKNKLLLASLENNESTIDKELSNLLNQNEDNVFENDQSLDEIYSLFNEENNNDLNENKEEEKVLATEEPEVKKQVIEDQNQNDNQNDNELEDDYLSFIDEYLYNQIKKEESKNMEEEFLKLNT